MQNLNITGNTHLTDMAKLHLDTDHPKVCKQAFWQNINSIELPYTAVWRFAQSRQTGLVMKILMPFFNEFNY